ncbi:MAG TPA: hypothetical protein VNX68_03840, partial [Nitrosopumilaceae archaeon]|nr:hypothetical protein [Nitrosopumilaceae archaeon]
MENTNKPKEEKKKRGGLIAWILLLLSLGGNGIMFYLLNQEKDKVAEQVEIVKTVYVERDNVKNELLSLKEEYETLHTRDKKLQAEIDEKKLQIEQLLKEAEKHKGDAYVIAKLRKETETLRQIMKGYIHTIDSLNTLNQHLIVEKNGVIKDLNVE